MSFVAGVVGCVLVVAAVSVGGDGAIFAVVITALVVSDVFVVVDVGYVVLVVVPFLFLSLFVFVLF